MVCSRFNFRYVDHVIYVHAGMSVGWGGVVEPRFGPAAEPLLFRLKWPKPLTPRLASLERTDANLRRADQLAPLKQGPLADKSVPLWASRQASNHRRRTIRGLS